MEVSEVPLTTVNAPTAVNPAEEKCTRARRNISCNHPKDKAEEDEQSPQKKGAKCIDVERIIMGEELCDIKINFAQLLKAQFIV